MKRKSAVGKIVHHPSGTIHVNRAGYCANWRCHKNKQLNKTDNTMIKVGLLVRLKAKAGKETVVQNFITDALPLAVAEPDTTTWYAIKIDASTFGIFDTFPHETGRDAHLGGKIAAALMANAPELLAEDPVIEKIDVLAAKRAA